MLTRLPGLLRRVDLICALLLSLAFAAPAAAAHLCAAEMGGGEVAAAQAAAAQGLTAPSLSAQSADDGCASCPDCGPACASGCCHAAHAAMASQPGPAVCTPRFERASGWSHAVQAPANRPAGPDRPPRA